MSDALPSTDRPLTDDERLRAACDWSDYRKDYGVDRVARVRGKEHQAFLAGWTARHRETALPTAADQPTTEPSAVETLAKLIDAHSVEEQYTRNGEYHSSYCYGHGARVAVETDESHHQAQAILDAGYTLAPAPQPAADTEVTDEHIDELRADLAAARDRLTEALNARHAALVARAEAAEAALAAREEA